MLYNKLNNISTILALNNFDWALCRVDRSGFFLRVPKRGLSWGPKWWNMEGGDAVQTEWARFFFTYPRFYSDMQLLMNKKILNAVTCKDS